MERLEGFEPSPHGLEGRQLPITPQSQKGDLLSELHRTSQGSGCSLRAVVVIEVVNATIT